MNVFQLPYESRLKSWFYLRSKLSIKDVLFKCLEVDAWWQQAPLVNHYLHPLDVTHWPNPWVLIEENTFCQLARGLGMYYTLWLLGIKELDFFIGKRDNDEDVTLISVDYGKYILNGDPGTVISSSLADYKINSKLDLTKLTNKIG